MSRRDDIIAQIAPLRAELDEIDRKKRISQSASEVGRCYRYRNCYSCPQTEADYWWLYIKVTEMSEDGRLTGLGFQTDKDGKIEFENRTYFTGSERYQEISEESFAIQFELALQRANEMYDRASEGQ